jgi:hypothetical protein
LAGTRVAGFVSHTEQGGHGRCAGGVELGMSFGRVERGGVLEVVGGGYTGVGGSRGNIGIRASNSRRSAEALVRRVVSAPVG